MFLPPLAALHRPSPPCHMSSNTRPRGLDGVVAAQTRLSHVDGQAGELIIGGYQLRELAGRVSFEEAAHLLWRGALPSRDELTGLRREIAALRALPDEAMRVVRAAAKSPPSGAPGPVLDMLKEIKSADRAEPWVRAELAAGRRIMGFGHRVYKVRDPRADVLSTVANEMGGAGGGALENRKLFDLARAAEQTILKVLDEVKPGRNLRTNVEFFTALVLQALGLEPRSFVATFACGRVAGWCAHVIEQHAEDHLIRPQSEYVGPRGLKVD